MMLRRGGSGRVFAVVLLVCVGVWGCGDDGAAPDASEGDSGESTHCVESIDCDDGVFCNGIERCQPSSPRADDYGCVRSAPPSCDDGIACTTDMCSHTQNRCLFVAADDDHDGHASAACLGPDDEPLGDDCDDNDAHRFPGNSEVCSEAEPMHDEDCVATTFGARDFDGDGAHDARCCNVDADNVRHCGTDCDDTSPRVRDGYPELCDGVDNDCNGKMDDDTIEVPWYVDADGDGYGDPDSDSTMSCSIQTDRSVVATDCNDTRAAQHPAAAEVCNQIDDDCDGMTDEGEACSCGSTGLVQPCVCGDNRSGFHLCRGDGRWDTCDCRECVDGSVDCLASLIPRACVGGRWIASTACSGITPVCNGGACTCLDGTNDCTSLLDPVPPFVQALVPADRVNDVPVDGAVSAVLSETIDPATVNSDTFRLVDIEGTSIPVRRYAQGNTLILSPLAPLEAGRIYRAQLDGITDLAGNLLAMPRTWSFITELDSSPVRVTTDVPASPVTLHAWPNQTALVAYNIGDSQPGNAAYKLDHDNHTVVSRFTGGGLCVPPCFASGTTWSIAPNGEVAAWGTDGHLWTGPATDMLVDRGGWARPDAMRHANDSMIVSVRASTFVVSVLATQSSASSVGFGNAAVVGVPLLATSTHGDAMVLATTGSPLVARVAYGHLVAPTTNTQLSAGNYVLGSAAIALNDLGAGLVALEQTYAVGIPGAGSFERSVLSIARVSATGVVSAAQSLSATDGDPIDTLQVVAAGDTFWIVYLRGNRVQALPVTAGSVGEVVALSDGVRLRATITQVQASGESDGTLHVAWIDTDLGFLVNQAVSARRRLPDGTLTRIETLLTGTTFDYLRSATYGARAALTVVAENETDGGAQGLYAIRN